MNVQQEIEDIKRRLNELDQDKTVSRYDNPFDYVDIKNIVNFIEIVATIPAGFPKNFFDQVKIYISGGTYRLYIYDYSNSAWRYATLT